MKFLLHLLWLTLLCGRSDSYPEGAPLGQCTDMQPSVYVHGNEQTNASLYTMKPFYNSTVAGETIIVRIDGDYLKGLLLEAREKDSNKIVGTLSERRIGYSHNKFKTLNCNGPESAITHYNRETKYPPFYFDWTAPINASGDVEFVATIVKSKTEYWRNIKSEPVYVKPLGNCTEIDYHLYDQCFEYTAFISTLADGIYDSTGICSQLKSAWDSAFDCIEHYHQLCEEAGDEADQDIASSVSGVYFVLRDNREAIYETYCDECGFVEANDCFYPLTSLNLFDVQGSCSAYETASECMTNLQSVCTMKNITVSLTSNPETTEAAQSSLQANLHQCQLYDSCPTVEERLQRLEKCINISLPVTFDNMCILTESYTDCLRQAVDGCLLLEEVLTIHLTLVRTLLSTFGCTTDAFTSLESDCNLRELLECYNPLMDHLSMSTINGTVSIGDLVTSVQAISAANYMQFNDADLCSNTEQLTQNTTSCMIRESSKCLFNPLFEEPDISIPVEERHTYALQPLIALNASINFDTFTLATQNLKELANEVNGLNEHLKLKCSEGCEDIEERRANFQHCIEDSTDFVETVANVVEHFQDGQSAIEYLCQNIIQYIQCAEEHLSGCALAEASITPKDDARLYQAIDICGAREHINYREPSACLDDSYNNHLLETIDHACRDITTDEFSLLSREELCVRQQEVSSCFLHMSPCCGIKKLVVEPRLFAWSIINEWLMCDSVINVTNLVTTDTSGCNLNEVLNCYDPVLRWIGYYFHDVRDKMTLYRMARLPFFIAGTIERETYCLSESEFLDIETCVAEKAMACSFPSSCLNQHIAVSVSPLPLPFSHLLSLNRVKQICSPECRDRDLSIDSFDDCDVEHIPQYIQSIAWKDVTGLDYQNECNSLVAAINCTHNKILSCGALKKYINDHLHEVPLHEAASLCSLDVTFLNPEPLEWEVLEYTTLSPPSTTQGSGPSVISTATQQVNVSLWVYIVALLQTFWIWF